ncbi:hypothetical protein ACOJIV_18045 [Haloarcula sp. AONF1]
MPAEAQGGSSTSRATYPEIKAEIGEDPARWLDQNLLERTVVRQEVDPTSEFGEMRLVEDTDVSTPGQLVLSRIRGIDSLLVIRYWLEAEHDLERGPRDTIVDALQARADTLKRIGERPDRLPDGPRRPPEMTYEPSVGDTPDQQTAAEQILRDDDRLEGANA